MDNTFIQSGHYNQKSVIKFLYIVVLLSLMLLSLVAIKMYLTVTRAEVFMMMQSIQISFMLHLVTFAKFLHLSNVSSVFSCQLKRQVTKVNAVNLNSITVFSGFQHCWKHLS